MIEVYTHAIDTKVYANPVLVPTSVRLDICMMHGAFTARNAPLKHPKKTMNVMTDGKDFARRHATRTRVPAMNVERAAMLKGPMASLGLGPQMVPLR